MSPRTTNINYSLRWLVRNMLLMTLLTAFSLVLTPVFIIRPSADAVPNTCVTPAVVYGSKTFTLDLPSEGTYIIRTHMLVPDTINNMILLKVDGGACYWVGGGHLSTNDWRWIDYSNSNSSDTVSLPMAAGKHIFTFVRTQPGVQVDGVAASHSSLVSAIDSLLGPIHDFGWAAN